MQLLLALFEYAHAVAEQSAVCTFFSPLPADLTALLWSVGFFSGAALLASPDDACQKRFSWFPDWSRKRVYVL